MDFGRAPPSPGVDFRLAPLRSFVKTTEPNPFDSLRIYVGCPVWNNETWEGRVYPVGSPQKDHLQNYARVFDTIELNATFYKIPAVSTVERWREETPADFRFVPKIPKQFSHELFMRDDPEGIRAFLASVAAFRDRLGPVFLQLPPDFTLEHKAALVRLVRSFPAEARLAIEFRHPSWFERRQALPRMAEWFARERVSIVVSDTNGRRDVSHGTVTADFLIVRFAGNELHATDFERLDAWVARFHELQRVGVREVYFFAHEPDEVLCPDVCVALVERLERANEIAERAGSGLLPFRFRFRPLRTDPGPAQLVLI